MRLAKDMNIKLNRKMQLESIQKSTLKYGRETEKQQRHVPQATSVVKKMS